jgi:hypothetical protein
LEVRNLSDSMLTFRCQKDHLNPAKCSRTPKQLIFDHRREFKELRQLRNLDGSYLRIYFRTSKKSYGGPLPSIAVIGNAIMERMEKLVK